MVVTMRVPKIRKGANAMFKSDLIQTLGKACFNVDGGSGGRRNCQKDDKNISHQE